MEIMKKTQADEANRNFGFGYVLLYLEQKSGEEFRMQVKNEIMKSKYDLRI